MIKWLMKETIINILTKNQYFDIDSSISSGKEKGDAENDDRVMVGAVTTALGASAFLVHQQVKLSKPFSSSTIAFIFSLLVLLFSYVISFICQEEVHPYNFHKLLLVVINQLL
uniref:Uncharacterized protein n=1 Tax=Nelumbo nucifera TaxID=4432 RepID=A0A822XKJ4_NELNU|nr:TPA_asm: hypothetical protein HUJ06_021696 [Nelumbo nucifera]